MENLGSAVAALTEGQKVFDRYTLMKIVGSGRMSVVWLAWDEREEHDCALKFLPDMVKPDPSALATLKREIQMLQDLKHEQIVPVYSVESEGPLVAIVSPAVEGATLSQLREQKSGQTFSPAELSDWMGQMCDVLEFAHGEGYAHGNLKPSNLMVDQKGTLRVLDFALERHLLEFVGRATAFEEAGLELMHVSPQQAAGGESDRLDDIYAFGASLYELLTSRPPFYTGNLMLQLEQKVPPPMTHRRKELRVIGEPISRIWEETVAACLSKDAGQRPQEIGQLVEMLELQRPAVAQVDPLAAEAAAAPAEEPKGMNKLYAIVGGLIFAVVGLAVFITAFKKSPEEKAMASINKAEEIRQKAEAEAKAREEEAARIAADAAKAEQDAERIRKEAEEAKKRIEAEAAAKQAELEQKLKAAEAEAEKERIRIAQEKAELERLKAEAAKNPGGGGQPGATLNADAVKKMQEAQARIEAAQKRLEEAQKREADRLRMEAAAEAQRKKEAELAARKKAEEEAEQQRLAMIRAKEREAERIRLAEEAKKAEAERKVKEAEMAKLAAAEALRKREEELARRRFSPEKMVWNNTLGMRVVKAGATHIAATEVRVGDFRAFVKATGYQAGNGWQRPRFRQDDSHPVVNVSWADAEAFCKWLTEKEGGEELLGGHVYRLPTDLEWSGVVGLTGETGSTPLARDGKVDGVFPWGKEWPPSIGAGNYAGNVTYDDFDNTAPVASFRPNQYGIYDLGGNVWEWCADWGDSSQKNRVLRGGSWYGYSAGSLQASYRRYLAPNERKDDQGFRVVLAKK